MNSLTTSVNNYIKQPSPDVANGDIRDIQDIKREFNTPKVGGVDVPPISKTPMADTLALKKEENPRKKYLLTDKKPNIKFNNFASITIGALGITALTVEIAKLFKKK